MNKTSGTSKDVADKLVRGIKRKTRKHCSAEESISAQCRRERIAENFHYSWSTKFLEAGKYRLADDTARQATAPEVKELRSESAALKELVADLTLENRLLKKKHDRRWRRRRMRYPPSEKLEIIRTLDALHMPVKQTLGMIATPSSTYYDWYARWVDGGAEALADRSPRPRSVWNRIPNDVREAFV